MGGTPKRVFIIDDDQLSRTIVGHAVRGSDLAGIEIIELADANEALALAHEAMPNLVLTDFEMPLMNGIDFITEFRKIRDSNLVPVIMVTEHSERNKRLEALHAGANDFLGKPIDSLECAARCANMLKQNEQALIIKDRAKWLEGRVLEAIREITIRERETLQRLALAGEYRDEDTGTHLTRMKLYSRLIAEGLQMTRDRCDLIEQSAPMHDIGKVGISDEILLKPGRHTPEESEKMRQHPLIGYKILKDSPSKYLQMGSVIAYGHHERFDGEGYPQGLQGEEIPIPARIVAVADVFDALTSSRPYKKAWSFDNALDYLRTERGKHFDPECVDAFLSKLPVVQDIYTKYSEENVEQIAI